MPKKVYSELEIGCFKVHLEHELQNTQGLIRLSEHENWAVRLSAIKALSSHFWRSGVLDRLFRMLDDPSWVIRLAIMVTLCREAMVHDSPISRVIERKIIELIKKSDESIYVSFGSYYQFCILKQSPELILNQLASNGSNLAKAIKKILQFQPRETGLEFLELRKIDALGFMILKRGPLADYQIRHTIGQLESLSEIERNELIIAVIQRFSA